MSADDLYPSIVRTDLMCSVSFMKAKLHMWQSEWTSLQIYKHKQNTVLCDTAYRKERRWCRAASGSTPLAQVTSLPALEGDSLHSAIFAPPYAISRIYNRQLQTKL